MCVGFIGGNLGGAEQSSVTFFLCRAQGLRWCQPGRDEDTKRAEKAPVAVAQGSLFSRLGSSLPGKGREGMVEGQGGGPIFPKPSMNQSQDSWFGPFCSSHASAQNKDPGRFSSAKPRLVKVSICGSYLRARGCAKYFSRVTGLNPHNTCISSILCK